MVIFVVIPLGAGMLTHKWLMKTGGAEAIERLSSKLKPTSIVGLLLTVVLLFGFQAETMVGTSNFFELAVLRVSA